jgi:hypothetical protein
VGFGLAALAALLLLLPGFLFVVGFGRTPSPSSPSTIIDQQVSVGLLIALAWLLFAHPFFLGLACLWAWVFNAPYPDPSLILPMLAGDTDTTHAAAADAISSVRSHYVAICGYFLVASVGSWFLGRWFNEIWPTRTGGPADWSSLLRAKGVDFVVLTVDGKIDDTCYLFTGILRDFFVGPTGRLERVVLSYAARRPFSGEESKIPRGHPLGDGWIEIPGEYFVLNLTEQTTVNVDYYYFGDDAPDESDDEEPPGPTDPNRYLGVDEDGLGG